METRVTPADIFPWNENFQTGIAVIDDQHHKLVELLNKLAGHLTFGVETPELNLIFDELTEYAQYHFKTEEGIWGKYLSADQISAEHADTHKSFVEEILKLRGRQETLATEKMIEEVVVFLTHWLAFHILESDKHMAKIVLSIQMGLTLDEAKDKARMEMSGALRVLIETILNMYDTLSTRTLQLLREVAERKRAEENLRLSRKVIDSTLEAIFITDKNGIVVDANPSFCLDVELEYAQIVGRDIRQLKPELFSRDKSDEIWKAATESGHWAGETVGHDAGGEIEGAWLALSSIKDEHGLINHYVGVISSITHLVKRQQTLEVEANHDALTGLPNRRLLQDRLDQAITRSNRGGHVMALCYLDLDGFKEINDTLGHAAGDEVLRIVAARLSKVLRGEDTVARLGGDEFVLLLGDLDGEERAVQFLNRLLQDVAQPMSVFDSPAQVSASIGVTFYPRDQGTPEQLLKHADEAMLTAKREGKSRYHFYS